MRTCPVDDKLLTIIRDSHTEMISDGFVEVETRSPTKCSSQLFAYKLFS
jgi:hypothetical protein